MNIKDRHDYDVVIVGTGISGAVLAATLTKAGKKVLMLEAGLNAGMYMDVNGSYTTYQGYLDTFYNAAAKVPNSPYPDLKNAQSPNVLNLSNKTPYSSPGYFVQEGPLPFASENTRIPGGTTMHWLGTTLRMLPNDFKMQTMYGRGVDWPFPYEEMNKYYEMAENEIGVSGNVEELKMPNMGENFFSPGYVFPMEKIPQSYLDHKLMEKTEGLKVNLNNKDYTITCISTPQGRNSTPNKKYRIQGVRWDSDTKELKLYDYSDPKEEYQPVASLWDPYTGERCEGNASCVPICPVQAKYNALKTLKKADISKLNIITQAVAVSVIVEDFDERNINGVVYKQYDNQHSAEYTTHVAKGKIYVLACSAIENAKLLLASKAANSSDQVGRNLMDHMVMLTWGLTPEPIYPYRGPGSTTNIPTFRDGEFRKEHAAWISPLDNWGWSWPTGAPGSDLTNAMNSGLFGKKLREEMNYIITRQFLLHFECEQIPEEGNRVTIDDRYLDRLGNYRPILHYSASDYMKKSFEAAQKVSEQIFAANNIENKTLYKPTDADYVVYKGQQYTFFGAGHLVGTHRMGTAPENSVVNSDQKCWDHDNLYLVGCGNMPTLGTSNPTLTMTALTFKAAEAILRQLENQ